MSAESGGSLRLMIVDDHEVVLEGWASLFRQSDTVAVVATASSGEEAIAIVAESPVDVCLLDLRLPGIAGPELIEQLLLRSPDTRVVVLTVHGEREDIAACIAAGAAGYLDKDNNPSDDLEHIMRAITGGKIVIDFVEPVRELMYLGLVAAGRDGSTTRPSAREIQVLEAVADGLSNREIGERLDITEQTVKNTLASAMRKLRAPNRTAAAMVARDEGFIG